MFRKGHGPRPPGGFSLRAREKWSGVSDSVLVLWDEAFLDYDLGPEHPLHPVRLELTVALARQLGVLGRPGVRVAKPQSASDALLELVHDPSYLNAVRRAPDDMTGRLGLRYGLGTDDNPLFERMHESSALITGATLDAARAVHEGTAQHAVNLAGGLHHAMRDRASGFCVYNDPAVAIAWLLTQGVSRIASRRRRAGRLLRRPPGADDQPARERLHVVSRHRFSHRDRRGRGHRQCGQCRATRRHRRWRLAPGVSCRRAAVAPRVPTRDHAQPARLRQPPARPAGGPDAHRG